MKNISIEAVDEIYKCVRDVTIITCRVQAPELYSFNRNIFSFLGSLGDYSLDDFWNPAVRRLKRFWFDVSAAPLRDYIIRESSHSLSLILQKKVATCAQVYPAIEEPLLSLVEQLENLSEKKLDYILNAILELAHKQGGMAQSAILVKESRMIPDVEKTVDEISVLQGCEVVCPADLRFVTSYNNIYIIGLSSWFPAYIFTAPRATHIYKIIYRWMHDAWNPVTDLPDAIQSDIVSGQSSQIDEDQSQEMEIGNIEFILPELDFQYIARKEAEEFRSSSDEEHLDANIILLEEEWFVFLDANDNSTVLIIDLDEEDERRFKRLNTNEIEVGMFILLRTSGGGDYIIPIADRIMGEKSLFARECQRNWKSCLRGMVKRHGINSVMAQLKSAGATRANEMNIHNWMSESGIRTHDRKDFDAILSLVGLGAEADTYWQEMRGINEAHHQAGMYIRRLLLDQVSRADLGQLRRSGKIDFSLANEESGSLTAFRVRAISPNTVQVSAGKIGLPFKREADDEQV